MSAQKYMEHNAAPMSYSFLNITPQHTSDGPCEISKLLTSARLSTDRWPDSFRQPTCPLCKRYSIRSSMFTNWHNKVEKIRTSRMEARWKTLTSNNTNTAKVKT